jgi:hypothetical protein
VAKTKKNKKRLAEFGGRWIAQSENGVFYVYWLDEAARQTRLIPLTQVHLYVVSASGRIAPGFSSDSLD